MGAIGYFGAIQALIMVSAVENTVYDRAEYRPYPIYFPLASLIFYYEYEMRMTARNAARL